MSAATAPVAVPFSGVLSVLCTPFDHDGAVDEGSLRRLVRHQLDSGVDGMVVHGLAGESYKLADAERERVLAVVVEAVAGAVPVIAGCDHAGSYPAAARARQAAAAGADGVMALPPTFTKPSAAELQQHYLRLGDAGLPLVVQDASAWTGVELSVDQAVTIAADAGVPVAVKVESPPTAPAMRRLRAAGVPAIGGYGALHLAEELDAGVCGFMPGCALPALHVDLWRAWQEGDGDRAFGSHARILPLLAFQMSSLDVFVAAQKELLAEAGVLSSRVVRSPGAALDEHQRRWLWQLLERIDLGHAQRIRPVTLTS